MLGEYAPITLMVIITIMLIEAAGSVDESTMSKLPRKYNVTYIPSYPALHYAKILKYA